MKESVQHWMINVREFGDTVALQPINNATINSTQRVQSMDIVEQILLVVIRNAKQSMLNTSPPRYGEFNNFFFSGMLFVVHYNVKTVTDNRTSIRNN